MDDDFDIDIADPIVAFLRSQLNAKRSENANLEGSLRYREELAAGYRQDIVNISESVTLGQIRKKLINGTYVLGMEVKNDSDCPLTDLSACLTWTSIFTLTYNFYILPPNSLKHTSNLTQRAHIIITLNTPLFVDQISYTLFGALSYKLNNKTINLKFPSSIQLTPQDVTDETIIVHLPKVLDGCLEDLQSLALSCEKNEFVMVLPDNSTNSIETIMGVDCHLSKVSVPLEGRGKLFLAYKLCRDLDGSLLEVVGEDGDRTVQLSTYCKDLQITTSLLHYLHIRIIGVVIVPKALYRPDENIDQLTDQLKVSLLKEIDHLEQIAATNINSKDSRSKLADLEFITDSIVSHINDKTCN